MAASTSEKLSARVVTTVVPSSGTARSIDVTGDLNPKKEELAALRILVVMAGSDLTTSMTSWHSVSGSRASSSSFIATEGKVGNCEDDRIFFWSTIGALDRGRWVPRRCRSHRTGRILSMPGPQGARANISHTTPAAGPLERCGRPSLAVGAHCASGAEYAG